MTTRNYLPAEILEIIAEHLSVSDCYNCQAVCRAWRPIFRPRAFSTVQINTCNRYRKFLHLAWDIGPFVQELNLGRDKRMTQKEIYNLALYLPNLEKFYFKEQALLNISFERAFSKWKHLKQLPMLSLPKIAEPLIFSIGPQLTTLKLLSRLAQWFLDRDELMNSVPNLESLSLCSKRGLVNTLNVCPTRLAALHRCVPKLKTLVLEGAMFATCGSLEMILEFTFEKMHELTIRKGYITDIRWIGFLSRVFASAKIADLFMKIDTGDGVYEDEQTLLLDLVQGLQELQRVQLRTFDAIESDRLLSALRDLQASGKRYKYFAINETNEKQLQIAILDLLDPGIESLEITATPDLTNTAELMQPIRAFQLLKTLVLDMEDAGNASADIHDLLCDLPRLKTFSARYCYLDNFVQEHTSDYPLTELSLYKSTISKSALAYISRCCSSIRRLSIVECSIQAEQDTLCMEISLPKCTLASCQIKRTSMLPTQEKDGERVRNPRFATMLRLIQTDKDTENVYHDYWKYDARFSPHRKKFYLVKYTIDLKILSCQEHPDDDWLGRYERIYPSCKERWKESLEDGHLKLLCAHVNELELQFNDASRVVTKRVT